MQKLIFGIISLCTFFIVLSLTSCKKDSVSSQDKITGTWSVDVAKTYVVSQGDTINETDTLDAGSYLIFAKAGVLSYIAESDTTTSTWSISGSKLMTGMSVEGQVMTDGFDIQQLTDTKMQLHHKQTQGNDFSEITLWLSKQQQQ